MPASEHLDITMGFRVKYSPRGEKAPQLLYLHPSTSLIRSQLSPRVFRLDWGMADVDHRTMSNRKESWREISETY